MDLSNHCVHPCQNKISFAVILRLSIRTIILPFQLGTLQGAVQHLTRPFIFIHNFYTTKLEGLDTCSSRLPSQMLQEGRRRCTEDTDLIQTIASKLVTPEVLASTFPPQTPFCDSNLSTVFVDRRLLPACDGESVGRGHSFVRFQWRTLIHVLRKVHAFGAPANGRPYLH